jgi:hypothetical protein
MLKIITTLTLFLIGILAKGQEVEMRTVSSFSKIKVKHGIELVYTESATTSIRIEAPSQSTLNNITTKVSGKTLTTSITIDDALFAEKLNIKLSSGASLTGTMKVNGTTMLQASEHTSFNGKIEASAINGNFTQNAKINLTGKSQLANAVIQTHPSTPIPI